MGSFWLWFAAGTVLIVGFSWTVSIRARRFHGVARFFAFEGILALFLLNVRGWFHEPASALHLLSWGLLAGSAVLAAGSILFYFMRAAPRGQFENSTRLVETGIYRYIRHPMYGALMLLGLGIWLKRITALTSVLAAVVVLALVLTALIEEGEMRIRFGEAYAAYKRKTKRFIPFLFILAAGFWSGLFAFRPDTPARSYAIVGTMQDKCYDNRGEIAPPKLGGAFYGLDAQHRGRPASYTLSADMLTVLDDVTGLAWHRATGSGSTTSSDSSAPKTNKVTGKAIPK